MNELKNLNNEKMDDMQEIIKEKDTTIKNKELYFRQGFVEDNKHKILYDALSKCNKFKEIDMDISTSDPNMLLSRTHEKKVTVEINTVTDKRLIVVRNDRYQTRILNILIDEITDCLIHVIDGKLYELEFIMDGLRYGISLFI